MKRAVILILMIAGRADAAAGAQPAKAIELPPGTQAIRLALHPARAPVPALKYRLLPELRDLKTGNAVFLYYRCFSPEWQFYRRPEFSKTLDAWTDSRKPPSKDLDWLRSTAALKEMDLGARRTTVDWEMTDRLRQTGMYFLLPDIQGFRTFAVMLAARTRLEALDGKFDKAIYSLQTGYKLGRDVGDAPTLIQALVGIAIANQMFIQTEEIIQLPGSPNLYWALTDLPRPFVSLQKPYQGERLIIDSIFPGAREVLADPQAKPLAEEQVQTMLNKLMQETQESGLRSNVWHSRLAIVAYAAKCYPEAKRFLLSQGRSPDAVNSMSVMQALLLFEVHNYDRFYDAFVTSASLPPKESFKYLAAAEKELRRDKAEFAPGTLVAALLAPAVQKVQEGTFRTDRRIAAMRVIEALRIHLALHDGKLPATLDEIKEVPIPIDPMTGDPFQYRVENNRATLYAPAPVGRPAYSGTVLLYELTVK